MSKARPSLSPDFWRAIELAAGSDRAEDLADVGRYLASRGESAAFVAELERAVAGLGAAGVADVLRETGCTSDGRPIADLSAADVEHCLEAMVLAQEPWFDMLLARPELARGLDQVPVVDLRGAVQDAAARTSASGPLWVERPGDRRRDGTPWILIHLARGVGLEPMTSYPWRDKQFHLRFVKTALFRSLTDEWRGWRSALGAKRLDVWLEYVLPGEDEPERVTVTDRGPSAAVTIIRHVDHLDIEDPVALGDREASFALSAARAALSA